MRILYSLRIAELEQQVAWLNTVIDRLRAALEAVEYAPMERRCPWCYGFENEIGHHPNCQRQAALAALGD